MDETPSEAGSAVVRLRAPRATAVAGILFSILLSVHILIADRREPSKAGTPAACVS